MGRTATATNDDTATTVEAPKIVMRSLASLKFASEAPAGLDLQVRKSSDQEGFPALKASIGAGTVHVRLRDPAQRPEAGRLLTTALGTTVQEEADPAALTARAEGSEQGAAAQASRALAALAEAGIVVDDFSLGQPSLDEVFLALTDRPAEVAA